MAKKNPNLNQGIIVTVSKSASVKLGLPCQRLHRCISKLLHQAKVRSTEYSFSLQGVRYADPAEFPPVNIKSKPDTTLEFNVSFVLADGEMFVGNLKAPVKCRDDGLITELTKAAETINASGWIEQHKQTLSILPPAKPTLTTEQVLAKKMEDLLRNLVIELSGIERDITNLTHKKHQLLKIQGELQAHIRHLKGGSDE